VTALVRWVSFLILIICTVTAWDGTRSWTLLILMTVSVLTLFWSFGAFHRDVWFGPPELDAECARIDAEITAESRAHEARREVRLRRLNA
jgi:hypothetical protein